MDELMSYTQHVLSAIHAGAGVVSNSVLPTEDIPKTRCALRVSSSARVKFFILHEHATRHNPYSHAYFFYVALITMYMFVISINME